MHMTKRQFLWNGGMLALGGLAMTACGGQATAKGKFTVTHSDAEWHKLLSPAAFNVLRRADTEAPFSSKLNDEHRRGTFICAGCAQKLFASETKFNSGTGWPSFFRPLAGAVGTSSDYSIGSSRTEVHCARCGGHLGHVFEDGPPPTGLRYCMNGVAMQFVSA